jgi:hypothetical protein
MDRMLNRRTFLKTSAVSLPLAAAIQTFNPATISAETIADAATGQGSANNRKSDFLVNESLKHAFFSADPRREINLHRVKFVHRARARPWH